MQINLDKNSGLPLGIDGGVSSRPQISRQEPAAWVDPLAHLRQNRTTKGISVG